MKITGFKLTFSPYNAFIFFVKLLLVALVVYLGWCQVFFWSNYNDKKVVTVEITVRIMDETVIGHDKEGNLDYRFSPPDWDKAVFGSEYRITRSIMDSQEYKFVHVTVWFTIVFGCIGLLVLLIWGIIWITSPEGKKEITLDLTDINLSRDSRYKELT